MPQTNDDDYHPTERAGDIWEIIEDSCYCHSRQAEATVHQALWPLPKLIVRWVKNNVEIRWKRKNDVAVLHDYNARRPYLIILDTKLENESIAIRKAILVLKIAEAYLIGNPSGEVTREELAVQWGAELAVLDSEAVQGLRY